MQNIQTEVLVIGGGATGTGVARDLAMQGFKTILVEKRDLTHGTSGRYHGLLHSGGRYVVKDPLAAKECIEENRILRRIMPNCIEDTGGFFVTTPWDDPEYASRFIKGCDNAGIPIEEISIKQMLRQEPLLNPTITRCFRVPDASADSFLGAELNAESARRYGGTILNYHEVKSLLLERNKVVGTHCRNLSTGEDVRIQSDMVVNAAGAWAGRIANMAGADVHIAAGKGVMIAANHRIVNNVINRCKMPSDGDILVPAHTVAIIGTTDVQVDDPDHYAIEPWEIHLMLTEGDKLVPGFKNMRMLRAWAGVRPLYRETNVNDTRDITRAFVLLDHTTRDDIDGLITITSGKWTTYRKMAEVTVDLVCTKLGVDRQCKTHIEPLPDPHSHGRHYLGTRLAEIEEGKKFGKLICECELATYQDVEKAILDGHAKTIDDVRRDVRLGMGPCQGGFCTFRAAGIMHKLRNLPVHQTNSALHDFLQERWKGILPVLWGQQLRQERLNQLIYVSLLSTNHLPGPSATPLGPTLYNQPEPNTHIKISENDESPIDQMNGVSPPPKESTIYSSIGEKPDFLIIGAGLSGLTAAWQLCKRNYHVRVITKGWGSLYWHTGCIDIIGYYPVNQTSPVQSPRSALISLIGRKPNHPYAIAGIESIENGLTEFQELCMNAGYPMLGDIDTNWLLPSAIGAIRPTCLAPETMIAGDLNKTKRSLIIGFQSYHDFYSDFLSANLNAQNIPANSITLELPSLKQITTINTRLLSTYFESEDFREEVVQLIKHTYTSHPGSIVERIGFPAVFGFNNAINVKDDLEAQLGLPVFEIPTIPPSTPGIRLSKILVNAIENNKGRVFDGMEAQGINDEESATSKTRKLTSILSEAAARIRPHKAEKYILATGGILGGGFYTNIVGPDQGVLRETVCELPIEYPKSLQKWFSDIFVDSRNHPILHCGISVNEKFQPIDTKNNLIYSNLYAIGTALASTEFISEHSLEGVALATGFALGSKL